MTMLTPEEKMNFVERQMRLTGCSREEILAFLKRVEDAERYGYKGTGWRE